MAPAFDGEVWQRRSPDRSFWSKFLLVLCDTVFGFLMFDQEPQVFLSDPKGLETVLIKEGDVFEKPE